MACFFFFSFLPFLLFLFVQFFPPPLVPFCFPFLCSASFRLPFFRFLKPPPHPSLSPFPPRSTLVLSLFTQKAAKPNAWATTLCVCVFVCVCGAGFVSHHGCCRRHRCWCNDSALHLRSNASHNAARRTLLPPYAPADKPPNTQSAPRRHRAHAAQSMAFPL